MLTKVGLIAIFLNQSIVFISLKNIAYCMESYSLPIKIQTSQTETRAPIQTPHSSFLSTETTAF